MVLNVTVDQPTVGSFLTVWPTGAPRPNASNLNYRADQTVPNLVTAQLGLDGKVSIFNAAGSAHVIADVAGWFPAISGFAPMQPSRLADTRADGETVDGRGARSGALGSGTVLDVQVTGRARVPADATAVVVNVTAVTPTTASYLTVWPTGAPRPWASNLNLSPGAVRPNLVVARVGEGGQISVFNASGAVDVVVDVAGWFTLNSGYFALTPARLADTRADGATIDGLAARSGALAAGGTLTVDVTGRGGVPESGVAAVVLNVTVTEPTASGYLTVWPAGQNRPTASNLNFLPAETAPNLVVAQVGADGSVNIFNSAGRTHVVVDVQGWVARPEGAGITAVVPATTNLYSAGHVVSVTGGEAGGTVRLNGAAKVPTVGGHLITPTVGDRPGVTGRVTAVTLRPDGTFDVAWVPAALDQVYDDLVIEIEVALEESPAGDKLDAGATTQAADPMWDCGSGVTLPPIFSQTVGFSNWKVRHEVRLQERYMEFIPSADITVGIDIPVGFSANCELTPAYRHTHAKRIPIPGTSLVMEV
ncbi:MAG TPA: hypothetical protein PLV68_06750, partial [Ilumatobacteraceae bacterium]|nr:hypothetical protein [Ilumatobacteraceae bacterium]